MTFWTTAVLLVLALLNAACTTPSDVKAAPGAGRAFDVNLNYQLVLKRIVDHHLECDEGPLLPLAVRVNDVQHYPDLRRATITRGGAGMGRQINEVIELSERAPGQTEVRMFFLFHADVMAERLRRVALGYEGCF